MGVELDPGQVLTPLQISLLTFKPGGNYVGYAEITYTATDDKGLSDQTPATLTLQLVNQPPSATDVSAPTITNPVGITQVNIPALSATDIDGTIASYKITAFLQMQWENLYLNGIQVIYNQVLTIAQAGQLKFDATDNFSGVAKFYFTATIMTVWLIIHRPPIVFRSGIFYPKQIISLIIYECSLGSNTDKSITWF
jgi:hypothetical protein